MAKHYHSLVFLFLFFSATYAQTTAIPDANFEQALIDLGIDTDGLNDDDGDFFADPNLKTKMGPKADLPSKEDAKKAREKGFGNVHLCWKA